MVNLRENIVDRSFDPTFVQSHNLLLHVSDSRLSFIILDPKKQVVLFRVYELTDFHSLHQVIEKEDLLKKTYSASYLYVANQLHTIVPESLFDKTQVATPLSSVITLQDSFETNFTIFKEFGMAFLYAYDTDAIQPILDAQKPAQIHHASVSLISYLLRMNTSIDSTHLIFHQRHVEIIAIIDQKLVFHNAFAYHTSSDLVYYVLHCFKQIGVDTQKIQTYLYGDITADSELYSLLFRYIRHLSFFNGFSGHGFNLLNNIEPRHFYFDIFCQVS